MKFRFDSHVHTRFSDGTIFYNGLVDLKYLIKRDGMNAFTITDHNTTKGLDYASRACQKLDLPFIPGIEVSTKDGHVAAYGIEDWKYGAYTLTLMEAIDKLVEKNAVIVPAHPLDKRMGIKALLFKPEVIKHIHGYEVYNGASPRANLKLLNMNRSLLNRKGQFAGSDCHSKVLHYKYHIELDADSSNVDDILEAMRNPAKVCPVGPILDLAHWVADFPPAFSHRRRLKCI